MADLFLSYSNRDVDRIKLIVEVLEQQGWSVWWDYKIRIGKLFDKVIEEEITKAKCIIVVWSNESVKSDWVKSEADEGKRRQALAPVLIDNIAIPLEFRRLETAKLYDWKGDLNHPELKLLLLAVAEIIGQAPKQLTFNEDKGQNKRSAAFGLDFSKSKNKVAVISLVLLLLIIVWGAARYINKPPLPVNKQPAQPENNMNSNEENVNSDSRFIAGPRNNTPCPHKGIEAGLISVREAKGLLKEYGHYNGEINDTDDDGFRQAIKSFQEANGLVPDGCLGPVTAKKLKGT
jgi:hypothetical protein